MDDRLELTQSLEDYLEAIYELMQEVKNVRCSSIADRLNVRRPSVTSALRSLADKGLVVYSPYVPITLTDLGKQEAEKIIRRHRAMEIFLEKILGVDGKESHESACRMEHAMSGEVTTRLVEFVEFVDSCPRIGASLFRRSDYHCRDKNNDHFCAMCIHGCLDEIVHSGRTVDLTDVHREAKTLVELRDDHDSLILVQIGDELQDRSEYPVAYWSSHKTLHIVKDGKGKDAADVVKVKIDDSVFNVPLKEAELIEVIPCE